MGAERSALLGIVNDENLSLAEKIRVMVNAFIDIYEPPIPGGLFGGINAYDTATTRTDEQLKQFLEDEGDLQNTAGAETVLQTPAMTSSFAISSSLLGFEDETAKQDYFDTYYNIEDLTYPGTGNFFTVEELYAHDRFMFRGRRGGRPGPRTTVFCRAPGKF